METQANSKVSTLRSNNGGEFIAFEDFLASQDILHQKSLPYTPQQNGVVERKNRTVKEMVQSTLHHAKLPSSFWGEAIATSVYLLNRSTTKALSGMTLEEAFSGRKPSLSSLRVWVCGLCPYPQA